MGCAQSYEIDQKQQRTQMNKSKFGKNPFQKSLIKSDQIEDLKSNLDDLLKEVQSRLKLKNRPAIQKIFTASQYEGKAEKFHQKTNGISNTIVLILTSDHHVFGGFTPCKWISKVMYQYESDEEAKSFLFKIDKNGISYYNLKKSSKSNAIMNDNQCGPIFGEGHDLNISDNCVETESWANLGKSYECKFQLGSVKANSQLTSSVRFKVREYEVWRILDEGQ